MQSPDGSWVALFSGGKDSSWAVHWARQQGLSLQRLLALEPAEDSWMFHVPAIEWTPMLADSIGLPITRIPIPSAESPNKDATYHGDREAAVLETAIAALLEEDSHLEGIISGAVESAYQYERLSTLADRFSIEHVAPLWQASPEQVASDMIEAGFDIRIIAVGAEGLDQSWIGRRYDTSAVEELKVLADQVGVHILGEGGEFETIVLDGPHMQYPVSIEGFVEWQGTHGRLHVTRAWEESPGDPAAVQLIDRS